MLTMMNDLLGQLGADLGIRITDRTALLLDAHAIFTTPRPVVTLAGTPVGSAGRPSILVTATFLVRL